MRGKLALVLVVAAVMAALVALHVPGVNGPWYHRWSWRGLGWTIYPAVALGAAPLLVAQWLYARRRIGVRPALALATLTTLLTQVLAVLPQPLGFGRITSVVQHSINTSYYNVAEVLHARMREGGASVRDWMEIYPELMPMLVLHAGYKPPGWVFYFIALMDVFGRGEAAALAGGLLMAAFAAAAVPMTYRLARAFDVEEAPALCAAGFFAMCPSLVLFFPQVDQAYPALGCLILITWAGALRRGAWRDAAAFGALLALGLFLSAAFLMFGLFLAVLTLLHVADRGSRGLVRAARQSAVAVGGIAALYGVLWAATGFDPFATFFTAAARSQAHLVELGRPWPLHSALDLADLALGTGWISVPLIAWGAAAAWRAWDWRRPEFRLVFVGLLQVGTAVAVALFPGENARLMLPMMPLLMVPIGLELARWPAWGRITAYAVLALLVAVMAQHMIFLYLGQEVEGVPR